MPVCAISQAAWSCDMDKTGYIDKTGIITDGYDGFIDGVGGG